MGCQIYCSGKAVKLWPPLHSDVGIPREYTQVGAGADVRPYNEHIVGRAVEIFGYAVDNFFREHRDTYVY